MKRAVVILIALLCPLMFGACGFKGPNVLPSSEVTVTSKWNTLESIDQVYEKISLGSNSEELKVMGVDANTPNLKVLGKRTTIEYLTPNKKEVDQEIIRSCQESKDCYAFLITSSKKSSKRIGNPVKDVMSFERITRETGWYIEAMFVFVDGKLVFKARDKEANIEIIKKEKRPLGPLQNLDDDIGSIIKSSL